MPRDTKQRRQERVTTSVPVRVAWQDRLGRDKYAIVHILDISPEGLLLELPEPVEPRSVLTIQSQGLHLHGSGAVRYCRRVFGRYVVGLEFVAGLKWKPPARPD